jgi:transcriptional regulator GlxA family with amidase domain
MDGRVSWAIGEMERRITESLSVRELAAGANLSQSRFTHLFRAETGRAPAKYLRDLRLARARDLLESTLLSVKQVRASVGINDASHFTRDFRRAYGVTPRAWRRTIPRPPPLPAATSSR